MSDAEPGSDAYREALSGPVRNPHDAKQEILMTLTKDVKTGVVKVTGAMGIGSADRLRTALLESLVHDPELVADLGGVASCDVAGIQVLAAAHRGAAAAGKGFRLQAVSKAVREAASNLGLCMDFDAAGGGDRDAR